jgi:OMF family outer membrane factor
MLVTEMNQLNQQNWTNRQNNYRQKLGSILMTVLLGAIVGESQFPLPLLAQTPNAPNTVRLSKPAPTPLSPPYRGEDKEEFLFLGEVDFRKSPRIGGFRGQTQELERLTNSIANAPDSQDSNTAPQPANTGAAQLQAPVVPPKPTIPQSAFDPKGKQPLKISLQQAIQIALERNPNLSAARWQIEERKAQQQQANAGLNPTVSLGIIGSYADSANSNAINSKIPASTNELTTSEVESGLTVPGANGQPTFTQSQADLLAPYIVNASNNVLDAFDISLGNAVTGIGNVNVNWYFYTSGKVQNSILAAAKNVEASSFEYENARQDLIYKVITAYNNVQRAYGSVKINQASVKSAQSLLFDNQEKLKVAFATPLDVLQAETQLAIATQDLLAPENDLVVRQAELSRVLSLEQPQPLEPSEQMAEMGEWNLSLEETILKAFNLRAELKQEIALEESAQASEAAAYGSVGPQLSVFANLQGLTGDKVGGAFGGYNVGVQVQWDAFDGGLAEGQANAAKAKAYQARLRFAANLNQTRFDVESSISSLKTAKQRIETAKTAVISATEALRKVQLYFSQGLATTTDVILNRLLAEVRQQATGNRQQWEELEFFGIKLI